MTLDDGVVYVAPSAFAAQRREDRVRARRGSGPPRARRRDRTSGCAQSRIQDVANSKFSVVVPESKKLEATVKLEDDSDMADDFPSDEDGEYELDVKLPRAGNRKIDRSSRRERARSRGLSRVGRGARRSAAEGSRANPPPAREAGSAGQPVRRPRRKARQGRQERREGRARQAPTVPRRKAATDPRPTMARPKSRKAKAASRRKSRRQLPSCYRHALGGHERVPEPALAKRQLAATLR